MIVVHPGSRSLRIGRASDVNPITVPNVIARRHNMPVPAPVFLEGVSRPRNRKPRPPAPTPPENGDEYAVTIQSDDPVRPHDVKAGCSHFLSHDLVRCEDCCYYDIATGSNAILQITSNS